MGADAATQAATHENVAHRPAAHGRLRWLLAAGVLTVSLGLVLGALCLPPRRYPCFGVYGTVVLTYLCLQVILAHLEHRRQAAHERRRHRAPVTVVLPSFNEEPNVKRIYGTTGMYNALMELYVENLGDLRTTINHMRTSRMVAATETYLVIDIAEMEEFTYEAGGMPTTPRRAIGMIKPSTWR